MRKLVVLGVAALAGAALAVVPALAADQSAIISDDKFTPATVTVSVGEKVTWDYPSGSSVHNVAFDDGSYRQPPQAAPPGVPGVWPVSRTFDTPGEYTYICDAHPVTMKGKVVVAAAGQPDGATTGTETTPPPAPAADETAPRVAKLRGKAQRRRLQLRFTIDEAARLVVRVRRGSRLVRSRTFTLGGPGTKALKVKGALPRGRLTVVLTFTDDAGNRTKRTLDTRRA
jgi:plastocyanin